MDSVSSSDGVDDLYAQYVMLNPAGGTINQSSAITSNSSAKTISINNDAISAPSGNTLIGYMPDNLRTLKEEKVEGSPTTGKLQAIKDIKLFPSATLNAEAADDKVTIDAGTLGTYTAVYGNLATGNAGTGDVLSGKTFSNSTSNDLTGTMKDKGAVTGSVGVGGTFTDNTSGYVSSIKVTGPTLSGNAGTGDVLTGKTFYSNSGTKQTGTMANLSASSVLQHSSNNGTKHIQGDASFFSNVYNTSTKKNIGNYIGIRYTGTGGYIASNTLIDRPASDFGNAAASQVLSGKTFTSTAGLKVTGSMVNRGALNWNPSSSTTYTVPAGYYSGGTLNSGNAYSTGQNSIKRATLNCLAYYGFNLNSSSMVKEEDKTYTMPGNGTVYYGGIAGRYNGAGYGLCRIYKNGSLVDDRDIDSNNYVVRDTMVNKSFSANKGDKIRILCRATSGNATFAFMQAVFVYKQ